MEEEAQFQTISRVYTMVTKEFRGKEIYKDGVLMVGQPWERLERNGFRELSSVSKEYGGKKLNGEHLKELSEILVKRIVTGFWMMTLNKEMGIGWELKQIRAFLLSVLWGIRRKLVILLTGLGFRGNWRIALSVVEWVYNNNDYKHQKSRFVYTKLLSVLGKARRPNEALQVFNLMREDCHLYPNMPAYRSIAITLGQAGYVLNACVPSQQWKAVSWVLQQMRKGSLKPDGATYGLAMEVMLKSVKYDLVHDLFERMRRNGAAPKAITYKGINFYLFWPDSQVKFGYISFFLLLVVLVKAFWEEGKVNEAVKVFRDMELRGVVGSVSVYYELASAAFAIIEKMKKLTLTKPLEVAFTGMILSYENRHINASINDCISIFKQMKNHCAPNIGTINAMLKVYRHSDMFLKAKELFEDTKRRGEVSDADSNGDRSYLALDVYTYSSILEASASAHQWEYFEYVYKEMHLCGFQLDQNKHAWLLVQASIAGKWHLLEHAFDTILKAGEIPHPSLFTEMVHQTSVQRNYERAVTLVNSMAHAPSQVSENQWTDLFRRNSERFSEGEFEVVQEATVSNFSKSLISLCESSASKDSTGLIGPSDGASYNHPLTLTSISLSDSALDIQDCDDNESIEVTLDLLTCDSNKLDQSGPPPASEILGTWKERRNKEGIFLPFNLQPK
ncbi:hypothetical protein MKW98_024063 [Papaver atlanticum]|uniref:Pentatricopeptide repeat-containing protein n=1 Tax=Papaver atlanticum TaxID=357466 RepID=A0AAD4XPB1_9MAGN|nr:hypothetical protein MKW98_024063 [Papaver atlanticum]